MPTVGYNRLKIMSQLSRTLRTLSFLVVITTIVGTSHARPNQQSAASSPASAIQLAHDVPVMDGGAGPCSVQFTVTTTDGKPVYAATIKVHIAYGFGGFHKLDLQASTNVDGKANFTGLPVRVKRPPLEFQATKYQLTGLATYDPADECQAKHDIRLGTQPSSSSN
jgi:hypothetical protein